MRGLDCLQQLDIEKLDNLCVCVCVPYLPEYKSHRSISRTPRNRASIKTYKIAGI